MFGIYIAINNSYLSVIGFQKLSDFKILNKSFAGRFLTLVQILKQKPLTARLLEFSSLNKACCWKLPGCLKCADNLLSFMLLAAQSVLILLPSCSLRDFRCWDVNGR